MLEKRRLEKDMMGVLKDLDLRRKFQGHSLGTLRTTAASNGTDPRKTVK